MVRYGRNNLASEIDNFYRNFFGDSHSVDNSCCYSPSVDIQESADDVSLTFELPGMDKKDIKVWIENNVLTVSGERKVRDEEKSDDYIRTEIRDGSFSRSFTLPKTVDVGNISADYENGLLTVKLAKVEEAKPKEIEVKVK
jgi:HSP20 family protein